MPIVLGWYNWIFVNYRGTSAKINYDVWKITITKLKLKPGKCCLFLKSVSFLGHTVSEDGIGTDPKKTKAVSDWPTPRYVQDDRSFVGLTSYHRRFVQGYAETAAPLNTLMKKNQRFHWSDAAQAAFDARKVALTSAPILTMPTVDGDFVLDTDTSDFAIGAVLSQRQNGVERVIAYASRVLDRQEQNYCVTRKELLAVVHFLAYFKHISSDDILPFEQIMRHWHGFGIRQLQLVNRQGGWKEWRYSSSSSKNRTGTRHGDADALSRRPCPKKNCACTEGATSTDTTPISFGGPADRFLIVTRNGDVIPEDDESIASSVSANHVATGNAMSRWTVIFRRDTSIVSNVVGVNGSVVAEQPDPDTTVSWSWDDLKEAQKADKEIGPILSWLAVGPEQPPWEKVALSSSETKTLCGMWTRLSI